MILLAHPRRVFWLSLAAALLANGQLCAARSARPGAVAVGTRSPSDGPRRSQSSLAAVLRHGTRQNDGGFRYARRIAQPSPVAAYRDHLATYRRDAAKAKQLISVGELKADAKLDASELAAWTMMANLMLNLDEVLNKG